jgi:hypothetical protein
MYVFHHFLCNNLVANSTNFAVWFALTVWVYIDTHSRCDRLSRAYANGMGEGTAIVDAS